MEQQDKAPPLPEELTIRSKLANDDALAGAAAGLPVVPNTAPAATSSSAQSNLLSSVHHKPQLQDSLVQGPLQALHSTGDAGHGDLAAVAAGEMTGDVDSDAGAPMGGRPKRIRAVKFTSPSKGKVQPQRRAAAAAAAANIANSRSITAQGGSGSMYDDGSIPNNDYCESCDGKGHFLCCDGCPRSFHFSCLDPPLELDEIPAESWYCRVCDSARHPPTASKGFFSKVIQYMDANNPTVFTLPKTLKGEFRSITTGQYGEYVNTDETRPLSGLGRPGKGGYEDRDPYRLTKDKTGTLATCHRCHTTADQAKHKRILSCDVCELYWHLDCLDPPMVGLPPITRRWMCPMHADLAIPAIKRLKHQKLIKVNHANQRNNGDIEVVPAPGRFIKPAHTPEEVLSQGLRYQVPEQIVILDFWTKTQRDKYGQPLTRRRRRSISGSLTPMDVTDSSSLTSMEDLDERSAQFPPSRPIIRSPGLSEKRQHPDASSRSEEHSIFEREGTQVSDGDPPEFGGNYDTIDLFDDADTFAKDVSFTTAQGSNSLDLLSAGLPTPRKATTISKIATPPASAVFNPHPAPSPSRRALYGASREETSEDATIDDTKPIDAPTVNKLLPSAPSETAQSIASGLKPAVPKHTKPLQIRLSMPRAPSPGPAPRANGSNTQTTPSRASTPSAMSFQSAPAASSGLSAEPINAIGTMNVSAAVSQSTMKQEDDVAATDFAAQGLIKNELYANGDVSMAT